MCGEDYFSRPEISSGFIRTFAKHGPWMCYHAYIAKTLESPDSDAQRLGRAFHLAMSEPHAWSQYAVTRPTSLEDDELLDDIRRQYAGKGSAPLRYGAPLELKYPAHRAYLAAKENAAALAGHEMFSREEMGLLHAQVASVYENVACRRYVGQGDPTELAGFAKHAATQLDCKGLADILCSDAVVDFKTTRQLTANQFISDAMRFGYHYQAAHYLAIFDRPKFVIIAVRNQPPFESMVYVVPSRRLEEAQESNEMVLREIADCYATDSWHSLGHGTEIVLEYEHLKEA